MAAEHKDALRNYKDMLKEHLKQCHINPSTLLHRESTALDRTAWRSACDVGVSQFEDSCIAELQEKRRGFRVRKTKTAELD